MSVTGSVSVEHHNSPIFLSVQVNNFQNVSYFTILSKILNRNYTATVRFRLYEKATKFEKELPLVFTMYVLTIENNLSNQSTKC